MALSENNATVPGWTSPAEEKAKTERYEAHICHRYVVGLSLSKTDERAALNILTDAKLAEVRKQPGSQHTSERKERSHIKSLLEWQRGRAVKGIGVA
jgi:hypothetical protein